MSNNTSWNQSWWNVTPWSITEAPTGDMVWLGPIGMIRKAPAQLSRWDDLLRPDDLSALKRSQAQCTWHVCYTNSVRIGRHGRLIHARIQRKSFFLSPSVSGLVAFGLNLEACWSYVQWILPNWLKSGEVCGAELPWNTDAFSNQERTHVPTSKSLKEGANQGSRMIYEVACKVWDHHGTYPCFNWRPCVPVKLHLRLEGCRNPSHRLTVLS